MVSLYLAAIGLAVGLALAALIVWLAVPPYDDEDDDGDVDELPADGMPALAAAHGDARAFRRQRLGDAAPDAARRAQHQRPLAPQPQIHDDSPLGLAPSLGAAAAARDISGKAAAMHVPSSIGVVRRWQAFTGRIAEGWRGNG